MPRRLRAAIYCRISRDSELLGEGVERQEAACRALAERLELEVVAVHVENDVSASTSSRKPRPKYDSMIASVKAGEVDVVLAYSLSRLTRRVREFLDLIDLHKQSGVLFKTCVSGDPDLSTADGRASALTIATWDQAEAERTAERTRGAAAQRAEKGRYTGPRPFGYRFATDEDGRVLTGRERTLVIDEDEAEVIRECVQRVLADEGLWSIAKDLRERGVTTPRGGPWQPQPLRRMLMRWTHVGFRKHRQFKDGRWFGPEKLYEGDWPAIIERETHERVVAKLTDPKRVSNRGDTALKYLLTWLATCGACGRPLVGIQSYQYKVKGYKRADGTRAPDRMRTYPAKYGCPHSGCHGVSRRMDTIDEVVEAVVVRILERDGVKVMGGDQQVAREARERIAELEAKLALISDKLVDDEITDEQFDRQNARLRSRLDAERARLRTAAPAEELSAFAGEGAAAAWAAADVVTKRKVIKALMELVGLTITVDPIGPGAFSDPGTSRYEGIRVEPQRKG